MKSILILANSTVGLYNFRKELINELLKKYKVYISAPMGQKVEELIKIGCIFINTDIDRRGINPIKDLKLLNFYKKIIKEINPYCVLTYTIKPNIYGGMVCKKYKIPYIVNITGLGSSFNVYPLKIIVSYLYKKSLSNVNFVFFQNEYNKNIFINQKIITKNYDVIPGSGVNIDEFEFHEYPSEKDGIIFNFIGRVMKEKGIDEYLYAANEIKQKYPKTIFNIWGSIEPTQNHYKEIIDEYSLKGIVNYKGFVDRSILKESIISSHCTVLPSYSEGLANVLLESASVGRILIASNISGCKETIDDGQNGFIFEVKNKNDLVSKIEKLLNISYEERKKMGKMSRLKIEKSFNRSIVVSKYLEKINLIGDEK